MTIRPQYANEELVHKLRSMLSDLPTLRTRAIRKLKHWREAAIKRLLARQRELEKTLLDKFERLEFDTQLFVEKIERKKANQQRYWQSESLEYQNKSEIDRISTNLRSIREELEQSKFILVGTTVDDEMEELLGEEILPGKLVGSTRYGGSLSSKTPVHKSYENNDLGTELKRVLEICTSPQRSSSSLSADELSALQSLDHTDYPSDTKSKQTTLKPNKTIHPKQGSQSVHPPRRNSRTLANVPVQQQQQPPQQAVPANGTEQNGGHLNHKLFAFESFDDSIRRFQRLREIRKNLRSKYDEHAQQKSVEPTPTPTAKATESAETITDNRSGSHSKSVSTPNRPPLSNGTHAIPPTPLTIKSSVHTSVTPPRKHGEARHTLLAREPVTIPIERVAAVSSTQSADPEVVELYEKAASSVRVEAKANGIKDSRERRHRSRTLEAHQIKAVDNQIYGCPSKTKQPAQHRSESHKHRSNRLTVRRSSEDTQDKQVQLRKNRDFYSVNGDQLRETWLEVAKDHWTNLLENGWRPAAGISGVTSVAIVDPDHSRGRKEVDSHSKEMDLFEQVSKTDYASLFEQLEFAYTRTINLGNEFWRFLEIDGNHHLCLYHQLNKQFIMYQPDQSLLCFPWPYDGIVDISWSKSTSTWIVATQTQIIICNRSFSKILQSIEIEGDWPKRITSCQSSIFHTHKIPPSAIADSSASSYYRSLNKDRPQFLLERYDYKLKSLGKHILESSTIWDIEADDQTGHLAILCDVALLIFDYQLNLLKQIEVTGFKVSADRFGGWLIADYNASCIWQIRRNEYAKAQKILHVERPWTVMLDQSTWTLVTLSETQNRAKRLLFFNLKNIPLTLSANHSARSQSQHSSSTSSSPSNSST